MLKILNTILCVACENSHGLMGFNWSHYGYWNVWNVVFTYEGIISKMECANTCMAKGSCVAIYTYAIYTYAFFQCYHYSNRADLVISNEESNEGAQAYIKCLGTGV